MDTTALDAYLATVDPTWGPLVRQLHGAIMEAGPDLPSAIRYRLLMYGYQAKRREWVCAIEARKVVSLRFLFGRELDAPAGLLRPGSTTMGTIDYRTIDQVDLELVRDLVRRAVEHQDRRNAAAGA
jgi:hypothetical protein